MSACLICSNYLTTYLFWTFFLYLSLLCLSVYSPLLSLVVVRFTYPSKILPTMKNLKKHERSLQAYDYGWWLLAGPQTIFKKSSNFLHSNFLLVKRQKKKICPPGTRMISLMLYILSLIRFSSGYFITYYLCQPGDLS